MNVMLKKFVNGFKAPITINNKIWSMQLIKIDPLF